MSLHQNYRCFTVLDVPGFTADVKTPTTQKLPR